ncbi:hypothetical protein PoB_003213100 [Plakobranchus ocellatus]|uniref:Uncharacterized protein n=1 Tax=Plakobranchus ocellatus TaxID=259542 RepID=A0AAV4AG76_9GAST|nr:hypothetical protein PoB_003213100 [Plakobranchus ocellatus]
MGIFLLSARILKVNRNKTHHKLLQTSLHSPSPHHSPIHLVQIDLAELFSLQSPEPCEVDMRRTKLTIVPAMMPAGYIRVAILIEKGGNLVYDLRRYLRVKPMKNKRWFHLISKPYGEWTSLNLGDDLTFNAAGSFFRTLTTSYGTHKDFPVFPKCIRNCRLDYMPYIPGIFAVMCHDCDIDPWEIQYSWRVRGVQKWEGANSRYLTIPEQYIHSNFLLTVYGEVDSRATFATMMNVTFNGYASKIIRIARRTFYRILTASLAPSTNATLYERFDVDMTPLVIRLGKTVGPSISFVKSFTGRYKAKSSLFVLSPFPQEADKRVEVCSFVLPMKNIAMYIPSAFTFLTVGQEAFGGKRIATHLTYPVSAAHTSCSPNLSRYHCCYSEKLQSLKKILQILFWRRRKPSFDRHSVGLFPTK